MSEASQHTVALSDLARSLLEIESEIQALNEESDRLGQEQVAIMERAVEHVKTLSDMQKTILQKRIALQDFVMKSLSERVLP